MKVNYPCYQTSYWRDRLKMEALEALRDTLLRIKQDIAEKGADWFLPADPPEPEQPFGPMKALSEFYQSEGIGTYTSFSELETIINIFILQQLQH